MIAARCDLVAACRKIFSRCKRHHFGPRFGLRWQVERDTAFARPAGCLCLPAPAIRRPGGLNAATRSLIPLMALAVWLFARPVTAAVWPWLVLMGAGRAFLWISPNCKQLRAVVAVQNNMRPLAV